MTDDTILQGYAPGSWSQVAVTKTGPAGRVVGVDIVPAQPPKGVSTIMGDFLSPAIQAEVRAYVQDPARGRPKQSNVYSAGDEEQDGDKTEAAGQDYVESERRARLDTHEDADKIAASKKRAGVRERDAERGRVVDVVLSDMSAPWDQTSGLWIRSVSDPYHRMMNTSGNRFRDHAGSMVCHNSRPFQVERLANDGPFRTSATRR